MDALFIVVVIIAAAGIGCIKMKKDKWVIAGVILILIALAFAVILGLIITFSSPTTNIELSHYVIAFFFFFFITFLPLAFALDLRWDF